VSAITSSGHIRPLGVARGTWGLVLLVRGARGLDARWPADSPNPSRWADAVVRVLGARHVLQAVGEAVLDDPPVRRLGAGVDALHALTAFALAAGSRGWRPLALRSGATATGFSVASMISDVM
jgi:hypothetical protein